MPRSRPSLGTPFGTDGPWLAAILDVLGDLHDLIDERFPKQEPLRGTQVMATQMASGYEPPSLSLEPTAAEPPDGKSAGKLTEPAPDVQPPKTVPISEPAPNIAPERARPVEEPDPDDEPEPEPVLPDPPPRAGRGSSLAAWQAWADAARVSYPEGASRDDVIAACIEAGVLAE